MNRLVIKPVRFLNVSTSSAFVQRKMRETKLAQLSENTIYERKNMFATYSVLKYSSVPMFVLPFSMPIFYVDIINGVSNMNTLITFPLCIYSGCLALQLIRLKYKDGLIGRVKLLENSHLEIQFIRNKMFRDAFLAGHISKFHKRRTRNTRFGVTDMLKTLMPNSYAKYTIHVDPKNMKLSQTSKGHQIIKVDRVEGVIVNNESPIEFRKRRDYELFIDLRNDRAIIPDFAQMEQIFGSSTMQTYMKSR